MKAKLATLTLVGLVACSLAQAQDNPAEATPAGEATAPAMVQPGAVIPLIQFQDVPLTTAIENLARQAAINYILDPRVGYGQPDEKTGVIKVQPNISIRWENLTAEQALSALLQNYGLQLIDDPKTKISRVTIKDPAALEPLQTKIIQLKYAAPSNVITSVQTTLTDRRSKVVPDVRTSQLVVLATEKELTAVDDLIQRLDLPPKQVLIEAKLIETSLNPKTSKGIDWSGSLGDASLQMGQGQQVTFGNNALPGIPPSSTPILDPTGSGAVIGTQENPGTIGGILSDPKLLYSPNSGFVPETFFLNADGLSATIHFLNQSSDTKVIATPRAVTLDNEEADLSVTRAHPIFKNTAGTQGSPGGSEVTYTNLGTILKVTPRISANNFVNLRVVPEVSTLGGIARKIVAGTVNEADIYNIRKIQTQVMIPSGNTLVLGGLVNDESNKRHNKVPVLGDIPFLGLAFRKDSKERLQSNLLIFITPTIVQDSDFQPSETAAEYLKTQPEDIADKPWTAWDDGKPWDWSKRGEEDKVEYK
jgi:type II secretory pathway component GspD/PulD (secretin)